MHATTILPTAALAVALVLLGQPAPAAAETVAPATICRMTGRNAVENINPQVTGVGNWTDSPISVTCPIIRTWQPAPGAVFQVVVRGVASIDAMRCSLVTTYYTGDYVGSRSASVPATGQEFSLWLSVPAEEIPYYSSQAVECWLPPRSFLLEITAMQ